MLSRLMTGREQMILVFAAAAVLIGVASLVVDRTQAEAPRILYDAPTLNPPHDVPMVEVSAPLLAIPDEPEPVEIAISIQGAVARPGLYRLDDDARIQDLIDHAGGLSELADTSNINLAARLIDASTLTVPTSGVVRREGQSTHFERRRKDAVWNPPQYTVRGWQPAAPQSVPSDSPTSHTLPGAAGSLNINTASQTELETLPGIGPKYAAAIIAYRNVNPFQSVEELQSVSGIGKKRIETIRHLVRVN